VLARILDRAEQVAAGGALLAPEELAAAAGPLLRLDARGRVEVYVDLATLDAGALEDLRAVGLDIERMDPGRRTVQGWVAAGQVRTLAALGGVRRVRPPDYAVPRGRLTPEPSPAAGAAGPITSAGDAILGASRARAIYGVAGTGVRVGVISTGIAGLDAAKAAGELPAGTCGVQTGGVTSIDPALCRGLGVPVTGASEGTALLEIVHDLAPGADLRFCAPATSLDMVACLAFLGPVADVIVDDLGFYGEPYFEDGAVAAAARAAVEGGVVVVSAAGNDARGHYQAPFADSGDGRGTHRLGPGNTTFEVRGDPAVVLLQWSNPFGQAADDYDLCLAGETPARCAAFNAQQDGDDDPAEALVAACPSGCRVEVRRVGGSAQTLELFVLGGTLAGGADRVARDSVFGHPAVSGVLAVAAIAATDAGHDRVEPYSSRGPASVAFPAPEARPKPDLAALDRVAVSGAGGFPQRFAGTSAAAPHVAAIAALVLEADPGLTPGEVEALLRARAVPLEAPVPGPAGGWGRVDAFGAVQAALGIDPLVIGAASPLPEAEVGLPYARSLAIGGGREPRTVALAAGALPEGLALTGAGEIAGTPVRPEARRFTVAVTDADGVDARAVLSLRVRPAVAIATRSLPAGRAGQPYRARLRGAGGRTPFAWTVAAGALPAGLVLDPATGEITGTPAAPGTTSPTVQVTDALGASATRVLAIEIRP
jgi:subtilisin family serine protease